MDKDNKEEIQQKVKEIIDHIDSLREDMGGLIDDKDYRGVDRALGTIDSKATDIANLLEVEL